MLGHSLSWLDNWQSLITTVLYWEIKKIIISVIRRGIHKTGILFEKTIGDG